jgi:hypothetical protein
LRRTSPEIFRRRPHRKPLATPGALRRGAAALATLGVLAVPAVSPAQSASGFLSAGPVFTAPPLLKSASAAELFRTNLTPASPAALSSAYSDSAVDAALPEAPDPQLALDPKPKHGTDPSEKIAQKRTMTIPSDWHAQKLTPREKVNAGLQDTYGTITVASWFLAAGWEQLTNGAPNYGTDKGAFGERLGAAALRGTTQNIFSEVILAPLLHEDARYFVEGPSHGVVHRAIYAVTRPLITRNDNGKNTVNAALLIGYAGSAALTPTYYPDINHNFKDVASVFGGGVGGAALGYFISEFSEDALQALHLKRKP